MQARDPFPPRVHLICNAHLDPAWLWQWEEGAAAALSTFRTAADLCDEFPEFIFNHNEALLYQWAQEYDPALFRRIKRLVRQGRWRIIGGWHLQPDCNMPSGESLLRQIMAGRRYFQKEFGVAPTTAVNFDSFGHSRGLVQILAAAGYDAYVFFRPLPNELPGLERFTWVGYDGSSVTGIRCGAYNSALGKARRKVEGALRKIGDSPCQMVAWGVGNHGGGPSRQDLRELNDLIRSRADARILHSTLDTFVHDLRTDRAPLQAYRGSLNPCNVGCYSSMSRVKRRHVRLESALFSTEKLLSLAAANSLLKYPARELAEAESDLLFSQFHDILPGSAVEPVEKDSLRRMDHGLEILHRLRMRAVTALSETVEPPPANTIPIVAVNPHPYPVNTMVECELQLTDQEWNAAFVDMDVSRNGRRVSAQVEKEQANLNLEWRKRIVFLANLPPQSATRFDCRPRNRTDRPTLFVPSRGGMLVVKSPHAEAAVNARTGLLERYRVAGRDMLKPGAFRLLALKDDADAWGMNRTRLGTDPKSFRLMTATEAATYCAVSARRLAPVRVIENGAVRTVVEALFRWRDSAAVVRYKLPKGDGAVEIEVLVDWRQKDTALKLQLPTLGREAIGEHPYGAETLADNGAEAVAQRWVAVLDRSNDRAVACVNDGTYGLDFEKGNLRLTLLRSPAYSGHPIKDRPLLRQDRFTPRLDQGVHVFHFRLFGGSVRTIMDSVAREAQTHNETPFAISLFPTGSQPRPLPLLIVGTPAVTVSAIQQDEHDPAAYRIRLFNSTCHVVRSRVALPLVNRMVRIRLEPFRFRTFRFAPTKRHFGPDSLAADEWRRAGK